jgi:hypothetical protein
MRHQWAVPYDVTATEDTLVFALSKDGLRRRRRAINPDELELVNDFAKLSDSLDPRNKVPTERSIKDIVDFASEYGPLWLSDDGLPATRIPLRLRNELNPETYKAARLTTWPRRSSHTEDIGMWLVYSSQVQAIQHVVRILAENPTDDSLAEAEIEEVLAVMWTYIAPLTPEDVYVDSEGQVAHGRPQPGSHDEWRPAVALAVQRWLDFGDVRVTFIWLPDTVPIVDWVSDNLFGALAMQLSLAVAQCDRFAICAGCRLPFATNQRPRVDRDFYCSKQLCKQFAQAQYQRRRRARLAAQGKRSV